MLTFVRWFANHVNRSELEQKVLHEQAGDQSCIGGFPFNRLTGRFAPIAGPDPRNHLGLN